MNPKCEKCGRQLRLGEEVFEREWKVIKTRGDETVVEMEKRYSCAPKCP